MNRKSFIISPNELVAYYKDEEDLTIEEIGELRECGWRLTASTNDSYIRYVPEYYFEKVKKVRGKTK